ncbi:MAG: hypothetical protein JWP66_1603 [Naasia sp.]|nr:hypothetical protein [Naasia sp.]
MSGDKPSQAEGDEPDDGATEHEVLPSDGKPSPAEG